MFIIAEAGVNHNGDLALAKQLVNVATESGAQAVKFQTFKAESLVTHDAPKADYQLSTGPQGSQWSFLRQLELSDDSHRRLKAYCEEKGILFLSTPFDERSADFLEELGAPAFKIGSGELTNIPLIAHVARKAKPMIVSTGMSYLCEVETAVRAILEEGNRDILLLHCVSNYPADPEDVNLRAMCTLAQAFGRPVGFSDHTPGVEVALASVALGSCVVEKHLTLDKNLPGPDHRVSLDPKEFRAMVEGIRTVEKALGHGRKEPAASEAKVAAAIRRSLVAAVYIPEGTRLVESMVAIKRPGTGLSPSLRQLLIGRRSRVAIPRDTLLAFEMFE